MKIKFAKKTKAKTKGTGSSTPAPPVVKDQPGSEKLKEAYLTMAKAQSMVKKDKKQLNLIKTILDPLTRLAKAKCTMRDGGLQRNGNQLFLVAPCTSRSSS